MTAARSRRVAGRAAAASSRCGGGASRRPSASSRGWTTRSPSSRPRTARPSTSTLMDTASVDPAVHQGRRGGQAARRAVPVQRHLPHGERLARLPRAADRPRRPGRARQVGRRPSMSVYEGKQYRTGFYSVAVRRSPYNKEHFESAGLDPESPPDTWDAFIEACDKLKSSGKIPIGGGVKDGFLGEWYLVNALTQNLDSSADALNLFIGELDWRAPEVPRALGQARGAQEGRLLQRRRHLAGALPGHPAVRHRQGVDVLQHRRRRCPTRRRSSAPTRSASWSCPTFGNGAMAGKPITDTQGFGIPTKAQEPRGRGAASSTSCTRPERVQAMWTRLEADPGRPALRRATIDDAAHQDGARQLDRRPTTTSTSPTSCRRCSGPTPCSWSRRRSSRAA